jgi:hypothetical protein
MAGAIPAIFVFSPPHGGIQRAAAALLITRRLENRH